MTDEDLLAAMEMMLNRLLDARGLKVLPSKNAVRQQKYRERHVNGVTKALRADNKSVTRSPIKRNESVTGDVTKRNAVWVAYIAAYELRYGVAPTRNMTVNSQMAKFCSRIVEASEVAAFYVTSNNAYYVKKGHAVGPMLADAEKLRTEWATGRRTTQTEAHQADRTQALGNVFQPLIEEARARERTSNGK